MTNDAVIKALEICGTNENCHSCPYYRCDDCLGSMMFDAKTLIVNSTPIIRCKNCKHSKKDDVFGGRWCQKPGSIKLVREDFFCADGERRT